MRYNPSAFDGADLPVELVSWNDCQEFIGKLNDCGFAPAGSRFALPTEAQWEYACRAGTTTAFSWGDSFTGSEANCSGSRPQRTNAKWEFLGRTTPVGSYAANPWGLVDMHGNVSEWCEDEPTAEVVMEARAVSADSGRFRAQRGGDIVSRSLSCRSASRRFNDADSLFGYCGFRIVLVPLSE
jgi:sulfatase modifying factor 1